MRRIWNRNRTFYRELVRLGFGFVQDKQARRALTAPHDLDYLQPPRDDGVSVKGSKNHPKADLHDINSNHKYFIVLNGITDSDIERGAQPVLGECAELDRKCNRDTHRVVAFWVVSRVQRNIPRRRGVIPDLRRCPQMRDTVHFKQPRRSACMAASPESPLHGLDVSSGKVVKARSGAPRAVSCVFVRFSVLKE